jgi:hypothetical protein
MSKNRRTNEPQKWECLNGDHTHIRIFRTMYQSEAYKALSLEAREIYRILKAEYRGSYTDIRNGADTVICPYSHMVEQGIRRANISIRLNELERLGFITRDSGGLFNTPNKYKFSDKWKSLGKKEAEEIKKAIKDVKKSKRKKSTFEPL